MNGGARRAAEKNLILHVQQCELVSGTGGETGWNSCVSAAWRGKPQTSNSGRPAVGKMMATTSGEVRTRCRKRRKYV